MRMKASAFELPGAVRVCGRCEGRWFIAVGACLNFALAAMGVELWRQFLIHMQ